MNVDRAVLIFRRCVGIVFDEVVLGYHPDVGVISVDHYWPTKGNCDRPISREECPPHSLPQTLVCSTELRVFDAVTPSALTGVETEIAYLRCMPDPCATIPATLVQ